MCQSGPAWTFTTLYLMLVGIACGPRKDEPIGPTRMGAGWGAVGKLKRFGVILFWLHPHALCYWPSLNFSYQWVGITLLSLGMGIH